MIEEKQCECGRSYLPSQGCLCKERGRLEERYGEVWDTAEAQEKFEFVGFCAPCAIVIDKATGEKGSIEFSHRPRFYFNWVKH